MQRYVISAPRSGLNWLRFCVEYFYGVRTPGLKQLLSEEDHPSVAFLRSHGPLGIREGISAWDKIDPTETRGGRVLLILRHPLETFVRMAGRSHSKFACYPSNIQFYSAAVGDKAVCYYEDIVSNPAAMAAALDFLQIDPCPKRSTPSIQEIADNWDLAAAKSRGIYDVNQASAGGAQTKDNPHDFTFHQRSLWWWEKRRVWRNLSATLSSDEMQLLERYC